MAFTLLDQMAREGFEQVLALQDEQSGLRAILALHDTRSGPAFGGVRRLLYPDEAAAFGDALRLARAMGRKTALLDLPAGGGKAVILDHPGMHREAAYRALGRAVEALGGRYYTGPDMNTGPRELAYLCAETKYCTDPGPLGPGELAECTAEGVFQGMEAALLLREGSLDWDSRRVVIQGLGSVGLLLARRLIGVGARVLASEVDHERLEEVQSTPGLELVDPGSALALECDILAPCALGGTLHDLSIERLKAKIIAGAANNPLSSRDHGQILHRRGVLFVPDFAINTGALVRGVYFHLEGVRIPIAEVAARVRGCVEAVLMRARESGLAPYEAAIEMAEARFARPTDLS